MHELIRMQAAFHERIHLASADQCDGLCGCLVTLLCGEDRKRGEVHTYRLGDRPDACLWADQERKNEPGLRRFHGSRQGILIDRMDHCGANRRQANRLLE